MTKGREELTAFLQRMAAKNAVFLAESERNTSEARTKIDAEGLVVHNAEWASQPSISMGCGLEISGWDATSDLKGLVNRLPDGSAYSFMSKLVTCEACLERM